MSGQEELEVLGPGRKDVQASPNGAAGISARCSVRDGLLVYEMKVPLRTADAARSAPDVDPGALWSVELETPARQGAVPALAGAHPWVGMSPWPQMGTYHPPTDTSVLKPVRVAAALRLASAPPRSPSMLRWLPETRRSTVPTTTENLKTAFAGESQANMKYRAFAAKAERDGFPNIARLFRATAEAERLHAEGHLRALDAIMSTADNLKAAIGGETYEYTEMYPPMLAQAEADGHKAKRMFDWATKAEAVHARTYQAALEKVLEGKDIEQQEVYLCPSCGYVELGAPPASCPICGAPGSRFTKY